MGIEQETNKNERSLRSASVYEKIPLRVESSIDLYSPSEFASRATSPTTGNDDLNVGLTVLVKAMSLSNVCLTAPEQKRAKWFRS